MVFSRSVDGDPLTFKVAGVLRGSNLVMYDLKTESWWQQFTGEALVGDFAGKRLDILAGQVVPWKEFARAHPNAKVLSKSTGIEELEEAYGGNPYAGYDSYAGPYTPFVIGVANLRIDPVERVVGVARGDEVIAYPFSQLAEVEVLNDKVDGNPVLILYRGDTLSTTDAPRIANSRRAGSTGVYRPVVDGQRLTFQLTEQRLLKDDQTGSLWTFQGQAVDGPLKGSQLASMEHLVSFWFAWAAFHPESDIYGMDG